MTQPDGRRTSSDRYAEALSLRDETPVEDLLSLRIAVESVELMGWLMGLESEARR